MSETAREILERHIGVLENWLQNGRLDMPSQAMLTALQAASDAMAAEQERTNLSYERPCAVLMYHVKYPNALLYRDPVTLKNIKTGVEIMKRRHDRMCQ